MNVDNNQFLPTTATVLHQYMPLAYVIQDLTMKNMYLQLSRITIDERYLPPKYTIRDARRDRFSETRSIFENKHKTLILEYTQELDNTDTKHDINHNIFNQNPLDFFL